jgi:hypothetical protein
MPNPTVLTQFAAPDPTSTPFTIVELVALLNALVNSEIQGSYIPYVIGHDVPGVDDEDKAWIELDTSGRPLAVKTFYNGKWRRIYNGMLNEIRMFWGDPANTADWDSDGRGIVGGRYDGWQICNGKNGSPNLTDRFMVGAHMDNSAGHVGYSGGWQTFVDGVGDLQTGGAKDIFIQHKYLPSIDPEGTGSLVLHGKEYDSGSNNSPDVAAIIDVHYANATSHVVGLVSYGSAPSGTPPVPQANLPTVPPFYTVAFMMFTGY